MLFIILFFVGAVVAGFLAFTGVVVVAAGLIKILFVVFLIGFIALVAKAVMFGKTP